MMNKNNTIDDFEVNLTELFDKAIDIKDTIWYTNTETLYDAILAEAQDLVKNITSEKTEKARRNDG